MDFTDDQIINLINEYEKYPVLWDPNDKFYKLNNKKKMHGMRWLHFLTLMVKSFKKK